MKHIYFCHFILFSFTISYAQDDSLLGQWYLDQIVIDNVSHNNYYNEDQNMGVTFTSNFGSLQDNFIYEGDSSCNSYNGDYTADSTTITINSMAITALDCSATPKGSYEDLYFAILGGNTSLPNNLNYTITGTGNEATLTITNPITDDYAVYGKTPTTALLIRTWYLSRIEIPGNQTINVPINETPTLILTNDIDPLSFRNFAEGYGGECNSFFSQYDWSLNTGGDYIQMIDFSQTLADCGVDNYESIYFEILSNLTSNYLSFEISEDGSTLTLTDLLGVKLIFGDTSLSVNDYTLTPRISLKENPVASSIELDISEAIPTIKYTIVTIQGQTIEKGTLNAHSIPVDYLQSGIYFLNITTESNTSKTLKFIKK